MAKINKCILPLVLLSLGLLISCTKACSGREDMTPEQVVEAYLNLSLNMNSPDQRAQLEDYTTGALKAALQSASDDTITRSFINKSYELERYSIIERLDRTPREVEVTFMIAFRDLGENRKVKPELAALTTTENTISVIKEKGTWRMQDVLGKKTTIDFAVGETILPSE